MGRRIEPFTEEMELLDAATNGRAVAKHQGRVIFVEDGVPGDIADVHVFRKEKALLVGKVQTIKEPSPFRVEPLCEHFQVCGGCVWQHMSYEGQLKYKDNQVVNNLKRIGKVDAAEWRPILGCEEIFHYRNKLVFSFSTKEWFVQPKEDDETHDSPGALGFHTPRFFDKVIQISKCLLQEDIVNDIRNAVDRFARENGISFYDIRNHKGMLRNIAFRTSRGTGEVMVILILGEEKTEAVDELFRHLEDKFPQITQLLWIVNTKMNSMYTDLPYHSWKGDPWYTESLGQYQFKIRPVSFFQTNPQQAGRLYEVVKEFTRISLQEGKEKHPAVFDLYSGTGSIGIFISDLAEKIVGIEYVQSAVDDAWENVRLNHLPEDQFSFYAGDMKHILNADLIQKEGKPDLVIADPPRQGMDPKVVKQLLKLKPEYIIYVSCKPSTQARDLSLMRHLYELLIVQPVDMFPHTAHVENVVLLRRREKPLDLKEESREGEKISKRKARMTDLLDSAELVKGDG